MYHLLFYICYQTDTIFIVRLALDLLEIVVTSVLRGGVVTMSSVYQ